MLLIEVVNTKSGISISSVGLVFCCCCWLLALVYVVPFACSASIRKLVKVICSYYCRYYFNSCGCIAVIEVDFSAYYIPRIVCSDNLILFTFIIGVLWNRLSCLWMTTALESARSPSLCASFFYFVLWHVSRSSELWASLECRASATTLRWTNHYAYTTLTFTLIRLHRPKW